MQILSQILLILGGIVLVVVVLALLMTAFLFFMVRFSLWSKRQKKNRRLNALRGRQINRPF